MALYTKFSEEGFRRAYNKAKKEVILKIVLNNVYMSECVYDRTMLEDFVDRYNNKEYPKNYPYILELSTYYPLCVKVNIGIPIIEEEEFDIDKPTKMEFRTILTVTGNNASDIIKNIRALEFHRDLPEFFT